MVFSIWSRSSKKNEWKPFLNACEIGYLVYFCKDGIKVKIRFEIKPPLKSIE